MMTIIGSGVVISVAIYMSLLIPVITLTKYVLQLRSIYLAQECFYDDKFLKLNEDEVAAIRSSLTFITSSGVCLVFDTFLIVATLLVHGVNMQS